MKLSIVVTNYRKVELLKRCLESVKKAAEEIPHEIMVVDSEAVPETGEMMEEFFPELKFKAFEKNVGYAKVINEGLKEASGDYVFILNSDMILLPDSLAKMMDFMDLHPEVGVGGPQLLNFDASVQDSCFRFYKWYTIPVRRTFLGKLSWGKKEYSRFIMRDFDHASTREVDWMMGTAMCVRRAALEEVGPMDQRFFLYLEDTDWCRRFWEAGWKVVYFPESKMYHYHGQMSKKTRGLADLLINHYTWIHIASALKFFWKYRKKPFVSFGK